MVVKNEEPLYPITVHYTKEDEKISFSNELELVSYLEFFDSEDPEEGIEVIDARARPVKLSVWGLELTVFSLK